jgi:hypothetical protein
MSLKSIEINGQKVDVLSREEYAKRPSPSADQSSSWMVGPVTVLPLSGNKPIFTLAEGEAINLTAAGVKQVALVRADELAPHLGAKPAQGVFRIA